MSSALADLIAARKEPITCASLDREHAAWKALRAEHGEDRARELSKHVGNRRTTTTRRTTA